MYYSKISFKVLSIIILNVRVVVLVFDVYIYITKILHRFQLYIKLNMVYDFIYTDYSYYKKYKITDKFHVIQIRAFDKSFTSFNRTLLLVCGCHCM